MGRISTYSVNTNVIGLDRVIGSDWQTQYKTTKNFTVDGMAGYYNKSALIDTGQFSWEFLPYNNTQPQPEKTFMKVGYLNDSINITNLEGVLRISALTLGNQEPGGFIAGEWVGQNILIHIPGAPSAYAIYTVDSIVPDGSWYYLMELSYVSGSSFTIHKDDPLVFGYFGGANLSEVFSVFGRTGDIVAQLGDYNTSLVTEGSNLYYTNARARAAISLTTSGVSGPATYNSSTGVLNIPEYQGGVTSFNTRTGAVVLTSGDVTGALGYTPYDSSNPAGYITSAALAGYVPTSRTITINGDTQALSANVNFTIASGVTSFNTRTGAITLTSGDVTTALGFNPYPYPSGTTSQYVRGDGSLATFSISGTLPTGGTAGQILAKIDATNYNTEWIDNYATQVKNEVKLGAALSKGTPVYVSGANGTNIIVSAASNTTEVASSKVLGLLETGGALNDIVKVVTYGLLPSLDTSAATIGDPVWLGPSGTLLYGVANKPYAPLHLVYIGVVTRVSATNGEIFINVENGFELDELHNVSAQSPNNKDVIYYNTATSLWVTGQISTILGYNPEQPLTFNSPLVRSVNTVSIPAASGSVNGYLSSTDWTTFNNKQAALGYTPVPDSRTLTINGVTYDLTANRTWTISGLLSGLTANYVPKATGADSLGNSLIYDTGTYVGINKTNPTFTLDVTGTGRFTGGLRADFMTVNGATGLSGGSGYLMTENNANRWFMGQNWSGMYATNDLEFWSNVFGTALVINYTTGDATFNAKIIKSGGTSSQFLKADGSVDSTAYTPTSRTLTINGTTYDLSADRSWTVGASASARDVFDYTATSGQTVFTVSGGYIVGLLDVYSNGVKLTSSEFTATNGTSFTLTVAAVTGDQIQAIRYNASTSSVAGSGTTNYVPKFTASGTIGNSSIQDSGSLVTIGNAIASTLSSGIFLYNSSGGTNAVQARINNTSGDLRLGIESSTGGTIQTDTLAYAAVFGNQANNATQFTTNGIVRMTLTAAGNIGIGTTSPLQILHVYNSSSPSVAIFQGSGNSYIQLGVTNESYIGNVSGNLVLQAGVSERMRITSGGKVLIGNTSYGSVGVSIDNLGAMIINYSGTGTNTNIEFKNNNGTVGYIQSSGSSTSYVTSSDYRLKDDLKPIDGLETLNKIKVYNARWKSDNTRSDVVIAHELQEILPYAVTGVKDGDLIQGVDYSKIVPVLIKAVQELTARLQLLENK